MKHLEKHNILTDQQHEIRKRRSCESQLIQTVQDLAEGLRDEDQIDAVLLVFSKAFDKVLHHQIATKLDHYGTRRRILQWTTRFLHDHSKSL